MEFITPRTRSEKLLEREVFAMPSSLSIGPLCRHPTRKRVWVRDYFNWTSLPPSNQKEGLGTRLLQLDLSAAIRPGRGSGYETTSTGPLCCHPTRKRVWVRDYFNWTSLPPSDPKREMWSGYETTSTGPLCWDPTRKRVWVRDYFNWTSLPPSDPKREMWSGYETTSTGPLYWDPTRKRVWVRDYFNWTSLPPSN